MSNTSIEFRRLQNAGMIFLPCLSLILHLLTVFAITNGQPLPYIPADDITVDCGSSESNKRPLGDTRIWYGDVNSKFSPIEGKINASFVSEATDDNQTPEEAGTVPYGSARLSLSEFSYAIPVTPGPKFVRLHFLSAAYGNFDSSRAFFSVKAGEYTLLSNFSVDLTVGPLGRSYVVKEFCLVVTDLHLTLTFSPSSSKPDAFAFVNGIEVVSMPINLYYSDRDGEERSLTLAGQGYLYDFSNNTALEMMYRLNIGGRDIFPAEDTGFFREWEGLNSENDKYLKIPAGSSIIPAEPGVSLNFTLIPNYTAPADVYLSGRAMGYNKEENKKYNLTWDFLVDSGFYYMVRLHFCEIVSVMNSAGDRTFRIYIANQTAEVRADVIFWTQGKFVPYFRDYIISTIGIADKKFNLSVALQANPNDWITNYTDALLNGVEIFKLNDSIGNLAGPNFGPILRAPPPNGQREEINSNGNPTTVIGVVSGVVSGVVLLFILGFFILRRARKVKDAGSGDGTAWWGPSSFATTKSSKTRGSSSLPSELCRYFSLAEIKAATNNFEDIFVIGVGGFGNVYKGYIDGGTTTVAIKRLKSESSQGAHEFKTEIEMLSHLRHRHLVSLIGYCNEDREMILVYDYMSRGTLRGHLYNTENPPLTWKQRLDICIGAARGLHYLHTGAKYTIIHRDVKTTNILLDEKWVAKVSDFGLSKMGPTTMSKAHVTTVVKGSIGYLDPEYYKRQQLSEKSDVYSFGVVLCEVLCGRPPILRNAEKGQVSLAEWAWSCYHNGTLHQIVDLNLTGKIAPECLKKYSEIAVNCMKDNGTDRPSMNDVVWGLEFAMQLQQNAEDNDQIGGPLIEAKGEDEFALVKNNNDSDGTFTCSWEVSSELMKSSGATKISSSEEGSTTNESIKGMSGIVFSEINDPKGR